MRRPGIWRRLRDGHPPLRPLTARVVGVGRRCSGFRALLADRDLARLDDPAAAVETLHDPPRGQAALSREDPGWLSPGHAFATCSLLTVTSDSQRPLAASSLSGPGGSPQEAG